MRNNEQTSGGLRLVPFNPSWVQHDKLDLKGIYKRPRYIKNDVDEEVLERDANGQPLYDITSALPIRQHNKWVAKGFVFVTLASRADLRAAFEKGTLIDEVGNMVGPREFDQHQTGGPWNYKLYVKGQQSSDSAYFLQLRDQVQQFGSAAVEQIRRTTDPHFVLPESLRGIAAGSLADVTGATVGQASQATSSAPKAATTAKPKAAAKPKPTKPASGADAGEVATELVGGFKG